MRIGVDIDGVLNDVGEWHYSCGFKFCIDNDIDRGFNPYKYMIEEQFNLTDEEIDIVCNMNNKTEIIRLLTNERFRNISKERSISY